MKSRLAIKEHSQRQDAKAVEIWDEIEMVGVVYGADDASGIRLMTRYDLQVGQQIRDGVNILEITVMRPKGEK